MRAHALSVAVIFVALARPAGAVDGVVEINQTRALAGGVTPGDAPGFPVTISRSGSYVLTGDLTVEANDVRGIEVNNDVGSVTLDLNGFAVRGPVRCAPDVGGVACQGAPDGPGPEGVYAAFNRLHISNGQVQGFGGRGVVGRWMTAHDLEVRDMGNACVWAVVALNARHSRAALCRGDGFRGGLGSVVANCMASQVGTGFNVGDGTISDSTADRAQTGFFGASSTSIHRSTAVSCENGFSNVALLTDSRATSNRTVGLTAIIAGRGNLSIANADDGSIGRPLGPNICGAGDCSP